MPWFDSRLLCSPVLWDKIPKAPILPSIDKLDVDAIALKFTIPASTTPFKAGKDATIIPAEGHVISGIEAALQLVEMMAESGLNDIETIRIRTQRPTYTIINKSGPLSNAADRDHCLQYIVAVVLLKGGVIDTRNYLDNPQWASDERVDKLRAKREIVEDDQFTKDHRNLKKWSFSNGLTIFLKNVGKLGEVLVEFPIGRRHDTLEQVRLKFTRNMRPDFEAHQIQRIMRAVENDDMIVHEFVDLFFKRQT